MRRSPSSRRVRTALTVLLAIAAIVLIVAAPFPNGGVLLSLISAHGIDVGDLPALFLLVIAARLTI